MKICEIFTSIQGESTYSGLLCTFVRLSGCNLRCSYCDTLYALDNGDDISLDEITKKTEGAGAGLVEITGGEPLLQKQDTCRLVSGLLDRNYNVLVETNGSIGIEGIDPRAVIILDVKTPGSGMDDKMNFSNFEHIKTSDEVKFVICGRRDYDWSNNIISRHGLYNKCNILFSPAFGILNPEKLAEWMVNDRLNARLNLQIHKYIFGPERKSV